MTKKPSRKETVQQQSSAMLEGLRLQTIKKNQHKPSEGDASKESNNLFRLLLARFKDFPGLGNDLCTEISEKSG
jgi:hypothetical protein